jgi:hypothetical protein
VKKSTKKDKKDYIEKLTSQTENAAGHGNRTNLYLTTKKLTCKFQQTGKPVKDKDDNPLTSTDEH